MRDIVLQMALVIFVCAKLDALKIIHLPKPHGY